MRPLLALALLASLPLAHAIAPEDDCGSGTDASDLAVLPPVDCEGTWTSGDFMDHDTYTFDAAPGDVLFLNVTPAAGTQSTAACIQIWDASTDDCGFQPGTMRAALQSGTATSVRALAMMDFGGAASTRGYHLVLDRVPAARATQVEEGTFGPALAVVTPDFDVPAVPEETQRAEVVLDAPMRQGHELVFTWDRESPLMRLRFFTAEGEQAFPACETAPGSRRTVCRADAWDDWRTWQPVDRVLLEMPIGTGLEWRIEYEHWLEAALS